MEDPEAEAPGADLVEAGRYRTRRRANDRGLVVLAAGMPYWLVRSRGRYILLVEPAHLARVLEELRKFEIEERESRRELQSLGTLREQSAPLIFCAWVMAFFFMAQMTLSNTQADAGAASSQAIFQQGEWWRAITALTLHADGMHFLSNLACGLLFARFLLPLFGSGLTWSGALMSGFGGNLLNAWFYRSEPHLTIGASTAVFGELGMLVAHEILSLMLPIRRVSFRELILPIGGGLAILALLGVGDLKTDYMAHFWGLVAGFAVGGVLAGVRLKERLGKRGQIGLSLMALGALVAAWVPVLRGS